MKAIKTLLFQTFGVPTICAGTGVSDIASVEKREDGLYDVTCAYGVVEKGLTRQDIVDGNVCEAVKGLQRVTVPSMEFSGHCATHYYSIKEGLADSDIALTGFRLTAADFSKGCSADLNFRLPPGYKIGLRSVQLSVSTERLREEDSVDVRFSAGNSGISKTTTIDSNGDSKVAVELPEEVFSSCATEKATKRRVTLDLVLNPNGGKGKIGGSARVTNVRLMSATLQRCDK